VELIGKGTSRIDRNTVRHGTPKVCQGEGTFFGAVYMCCVFLVYICVYVCICVYMCVVCVYIVSIRSILVSIYSKVCIMSSSW
jgi:hypothetical protein